MEYKFHAPPTIARTPTGQMIIGVMPPLDYTPELFAELEEAYAKRVRDHRELEASLTSKEVEVVSNSDPDKKYIVTVYSDGKMECDCKGYSFRRHCSHIDKVKDMSND